MLYCVENVTVAPGTGTSVNGRIIAVLGSKTTGQTGTYTVDVLVEMPNIS